MRAAVCGSGPGGMAIAAHLAAAGRQVTIVDLAEFPGNLAAIAERGGVEVRSTWTGASIAAVETSSEVPDTVAGADIIVVSVPAFAHDRWVAEIVPAMRDAAALLFVGEGSGSLVARRALLDAGRPGVLVGETNCLPLIARAAGPGAVTGDRKTGGVLLAAIPASRTDELLAMIHDVWPFVEPAGSVFETTLVNYDAIDVVPVAIANAATIENRAGGILLWGEGATPSVVRLIEALDGELFEIRRALGGKDPRRYRDLLVAQGLAPDRGDLYAVMRGGRHRAQLPPERLARGPRGEAGAGGAMVARPRVVDRRRRWCRDPRDRRADRCGGPDAGPRLPHGRPNARIAGARRPRCRGARGVRPRWHVVRSVSRPPRAP